MYVCPLNLLVAVAVNVLGVVTASAESRRVCDDSNFNIVSVLMDSCARIKIISQPCSVTATNRSLRNLEANSFENGYHVI